MSNFHATIGRSVQYVGEGNKVYAAIIVGLTNELNNLAGWNLVAYDRDGTSSLKTGVFAYVDTFEYSRRPQVHTYRLNWQGR